MLLLYCMTRPGAAILPAGVGGAAVAPLVSSGIAIWHSPAEHALGAAQEAVLAFHGVISALFKERTVIPFRFPTTMPDANAIAAWAAQHADGVAREIARLDGMVQMELHLAAEAIAASGSGRAYLEGKRESQRSLARQADKARASVAHVVAEWRQKETRAGLRCYALVRRGDEWHFRTQLGTIREGARVSGPWPPSEFLDPALTTFA